MTFWEFYKKRKAENKYAGSPDAYKKYLRILGYDDVYPEEAFIKLSEFLDLDKSERTSIVYRFTCLEKYGESYFKDHAAKGRETKKANYGEDFDKLTMEKAKQAARKNLGENYQSEINKKASVKIKNTKINKYGDNYASIIARNWMQNKDHSFFVANGKKAIQTFLSKYDSPEEAFAERTEKHHKTCLDRYGPDYIELFVENRLKTCIDRYGENFASIFYDNGKAEKLAKYGTLIPCSHVSKGENEVLTYIKSIYDGEIFTSCYNIINPYELDIYIPEFKLAIEFNGYFYHSEAVLMRKVKILDLNDELYDLIRVKHIRKADMCEDLGIRLIQILDLDWNNPEKQKILKYIIKSALHKYQNRIYARDCEFKEIFDKKQVAEILNKNHIQGSCNYSKCFGLFYKNEPIQLATIQLHSNHKNSESELNRMVTLNDWQVVGGFSKLVKNICKELNISELTSYIDRLLFDGKGYASVGFKEISRSKPAYFYIFDNKVYRREFGMRKNIEKMYKKGIIKFWDESKSERENMFLNKIPRIYNAGIIKVKYYYKSKGD